MSVIVSIADLITDDLKTKLPTIEDKISRVLYFKTTLKSTQELQIFVIPVGVVKEQSDRCVDSVEYTIDISVNQKIVDDNDIEGLVTLCETICNELKYEQYSEYTITEITNNPLFDFTLLRDNKLFSALLSVKVWGHE